MSKQLSVSWFMGLERIFRLVKQLQQKFHHKKTIENNNERFLWHQEVRTTIAITLMAA